MELILLTLRDEKYILLAQLTVIVLVVIMIVGCHGLDCCGGQWWQGHIFYDRVSPIAHCVPYVIYSLIGDGVSHLII